MKVLHILNKLMPSGAETMLVTAAPIFQDLDNHILGTFPEIGPYKEQLENSGYKIHHVYDCNRWKHHSLIRKMIKSGDYDIVHIHCEGESWLYALDAKLAGVKTIFRTVHSLFQFAGAAKVRHIVFRALMRGLGVKFIFISPGVEENEKKRFHNKGKTICNWCSPNFKYVNIDEKMNQRRRFNLADDCFYIITVGNCDANKNHKMLLEAVAKLKDSLKIEYIHIGHGDADEKILAKKLGIDKEVRFLGFQNPLEWLKACDCFICPSFREGFSISSLEALSTGMRCILSDIPGLDVYKTVNNGYVHYFKVEELCLENEINRVYAEWLTQKGNSEDLAEIIKAQYGMEKGANSYLTEYIGAK